jgi:hypothetical protein
MPSTGKAAVLVGTVQSPGKVDIKQQSVSHDASQLKTQAALLQS